MLEIGPNRKNSTTPLYDGTTKMPKQIKAAYARMKQLRQFLPQQAGEMGGYMAKVHHMVSYQWEGIAIGMLVEALLYLLKTLVLPPDIQEQQIFERLPQNLKYMLDERGEMPTLYKAKKNKNGVWVLSDEIWEPTAEKPEPSEALIWANGYMPKPTREQGLRNRMSEYLEATVGVANTGDPKLDIAMAYVKGNVPKQQAKMPSIPEMKAKRMLPA